MEGYRDGLDRIRYRTMGGGLRGVLCGGLRGWIVFGIKQWIRGVTRLGLGLVPDDG